MTKWWVLFALAIPASYMFSVELAKAADICNAKYCSMSTNISPFLNRVNIEELKDASCQIMYKIMYDDLYSKLKQHNSISAEERRFYNRSIASFVEACIPADEVIYQIEVDATHTWMRKL